jgi:hypothetical protein
VTLSLAGLAAVWVVPALLLRPLADPAVLAFAVGIVVGLGADLVRNTGTMMTRPSGWSSARWRSRCASSPSACR